MSDFEPRQPKPVAAFKRRRADKHAQRGVTTPDERAGEPMIIRTLRVEADLWADAQDVAAERDETLSDIMRAALREYVATHEIGVKR